MKFFLLVIKNIGRNPVRSILTTLSTMVLVVVVILIWSILSFLDHVTEEKSHNFKAIVTERWQMPSRMPFSYAATLSEGTARKPGDVRPIDSATWSFYGGTIESDPAKRTRDNMLFAISTEPRTIATMMDDLDSLPPAQAAELAANIKKMERNRQGLLMGRDRLAAIDKKVGDRITIYSVNYKGIDLEFDIVGTFPPGRYDNTCAMNRDYLNDSLDAYNRKPGNLKHPMADRNLALVWLKVPDSEAFSKLSHQIMAAPYYRSPAVKCETAASGTAAFLDSFRDLIWGMRWLLAPAVLATLSLVIANAISISVRERRPELAVLKVLGFRPYQILLLVLGESLLLGFFSGLASAGLTFVGINYWMGGLKFPIAFFGAFYIPPIALVWGAAIGAATALLGSFLPAWSARSVKVADVFAKVA